MPDFTTRPATGADAAPLVALVNSAFRGDSSKAGWSTEADLLDGQRIDLHGVHESLAAPGHVMLLHERDDLLVACVHLARTGADCYLGMLTVRPTIQSGGVGGRMLDVAERWAVEHWGSQSMHLTVIVQRVELIAWYERRGYARTGQRKPFPYGNPRFGLPRRDDLEFEVLRKRLAVTPRPGRSSGT